MDVQPLDALASTPIHMMVLMQTASLATIRAFMQDLNRVLVVVSI